MAERLTREQMAEKYPNQSIGITNIKYENNDGVTIESAEVVYTPEDKNAGRIACFTSIGFRGHYVLVYYRK